MSTRPAAGALPVTICFLATYTRPDHPFSKARASLLKPPAAMSTFPPNDRISLLPPMLSVSRSRASAIRTPCRFRPDRLRGRPVSAAIAHDAATLSRYVPHRREKFLRFARRQGTDRQENPGIGTNHHSGVLPIHLELFL